MTIIAAELDTIPPSISDFDVKLFAEYTKDEYFKISKTENIYRQRNNREYPWTRRLIAINGCLMQGVNQFPALKPIISFSEKLAGTPTIIMLYQEIQNELYDFTFHFDADIPYGFRICYGLDIGKPFLEFTALKEEYIQHARKLGKIEDYMCCGNVYTLSPNRKNTVLRINGLSHPHRVPLTHSSNRLVFIVSGTEKDYSVGHIQEISDSVGG